MKEHADSMDKTLKEKFDNHKVPVPAHIWTSIESNLPTATGNAGGNFFFKNPFILSILLISTVIAGSYIYYSANNQTADSNTSFNKKPKTTNISLIAPSTYSADNALNQPSSKEKDRTTNSLSKNTIEEKNQTINHASSTSAEVSSNIRISKSKREDAVTVQQPSNTSEYNTSVKKELPAKNNRDITPPKNSKQYYAVKNNAGTSTESNNIALLNASSNSRISKVNKKNIVDSIAMASIHSDLSVSKSLFPTISTNSPQAHNFDLKNNTDSVSDVDLIKIHASAFMQVFDSANTINSANTNTPLEYKTSTNVVNSVTAVTTAASNQEHVNISQISNATLALNANNTLAKPSEMIALHNQIANADEFNEPVSTNESTASNIHPDTSDASSKDKFDSIYNSNMLENYFHANPMIKNDTAVSLMVTESRKELLQKIDSTIIAAHTDTSSFEKVSETIEVKSNQEIKKKSLFLSRCSFDGYITPALGYLYLSPNNSQISVSEFTKERNQSARPGFAIASGLRMNYALTQRLEIGIGLQYSSLSQQSSFFQQYKDSMYTYQGYNQIDSIYDSTSHQIIKTTHFVVTDSLSLQTLSTMVKTHIDKFQNFSIPIHIAYGYSISNKLSLIARTSLLINYQTYSVTYFNASDSTIVGYHSNKNISLGGSFSVGCYYQFSRRYALFAEPVVTYHFSNAFDKQVPFKQKQLMLGLQAGIRLSL